MADNNEHLEDMSQEPLGFSDKVEKEINEGLEAQISTRFGSYGGWVYRRPGH